jgi:hypothetical protein
MTAKKFIDKKQKEHHMTWGVYADINSKIAEWMEEYSEYKINQIFKGSINIKHFQDVHKFIRLADHKEDIMNSIKNK